MNPSELPRNIEVDTAKLRVKEALNQAKIACGELNKEEGVKCFTAVRDAETKIDNEIRNQEAQQAIEEIKERQRGYSPEEDNINDLMR